MPLLNGTYVSPANCQTRIVIPGGNSILLVGLQKLDLKEVISPELVDAAGSYGPVGSTDGNYKPGGNISIALQEFQFIRDTLSALHPTKSHGLVKFDIQVTITNGVDPTLNVAARKCRLIESDISFGAGDSKHLNDTSPLLIEDGVYRNGVKMINPSRAFVGLR
jgi:hypothetical protein